MGGWPNRRNKAAFSSFFSVYRAAIISKVRVNYSHTCLIRTPNLRTELYFLYIYFFISTLQYITKKYSLSPPTNSKS